MKTVTWSKNNKIAEYDGDGVIYYDQALKDRSSSTTFDDISTSVILNISKVQCKDNGQYSCTVKYKSNDILIKVSTSTSVNIQGKQFCIVH